MATSNQSYEDYRAHLLNPDQPVTLEYRPLVTLDDAVQYGRKLAFSDVYGLANPLTADEWCKTLPQRWQREVEAEIVHVYHTT